MKILGLNKTVLRYGCALSIGLLYTFPALAHVVDPKDAMVATNETIVVPDSGGVTVVRSSTPTITRQQVQIYPGISKESAGSTQLSMNRIILPPGMKGLRHMHKNAETAIYILEGNVRTLIGLNGQVVIDNRAGDFLFIPANVWHQPINISKKRVVAIEARADADDQQNVILAPAAQ